MGNTPGGAPVTLDFSKAQPVSQGVSLDFSKAQPLDSAAPGTTGVSGVLSGIGGGVIGTAAGAENLLNKALPSSTQIPAIPKQYYEQKTGAEKAGGFLEGIGEFVLGDEALKGLDVAGRLGLAQKVAHIAQSSPKVARALELGMNAMRASAVGGAQGAVEASAAGTPIGEGAAGGAIGAGLGSVGGEAVGGLIGTAGKRLEEGAPKIGNALLQANKVKNFLYGKNPGRVFIDEDIPIKGWMNYKDIAQSLEDANTRIAGEARALISQQGGGASAGEAGNWFTPQTNYADIFKGPNGKVYGVDVPKDVFSGSAYSSEKIPHGGGEVGDIHLLPQQWSAKARPVESLGETPEGMKRLYRSAGPEEQSFRSQATRPINVVPSIDHIFDQAEQVVQGSSGWSDRKGLLEDIRKLQDEATGTFDRDGNYVGPKGPMTPAEITKLKTDIGRGTQWNIAKDEKQQTFVNNVRKQLYSYLDKTVDAAVPGMDKINERWANLIEAEGLIKKRVAQDEAAGFGQSALRSKAIISAGLLMMRQGLSPEGALLILNEAARTPTGRMLRMKAGPPIGRALQAGASAAGQAIRATGAEAGIQAGEDQEE